MPLDPLEITGGIAIGTGVGAAIGDVVIPQLQDFKNTRWSKYPNKPLAAEEAAQLAAEGFTSKYAQAAEAANSGINGDRFAALADLARRAPGIAEALTLWRRELIGPAEVTHALYKARIPAEWHDPIMATKELPLEPAVLAYAIVRGVIPDPGILPVSAPTGAGKVKAFPVFAIDAEKEALAAGFDLKHLSVMVANSGRPMSPEAAASAVFRGIIDKIDYERAIAEGDLRNEWRDPIFETSRAILSPTNYVEARIRNWLHTDAEMHAGAARHGMTPDDTDLLFLIHGRPLSFRQVFIGMRRGGTYDGPTDVIDAPYLKSLQESDIRPEWYNIAWHLRFTYPSAFVLRAMTQDHDLSEAETRQILLFVGWDPTLAATVAHRWATGSSAAKLETKAELEDEYAGGYISQAELEAGLRALGYNAGTIATLVSLNDARRVKRYREKLIDAIAGAYLAFKTDEATASSELAEANVTGEAATNLLALWASQRRVTIRTLTPAQVKKAYGSKVIDEPTALGQLEELHLTPQDAAELLAE